MERMISHHPDNRQHLTIYPSTYVDNVYNFVGEKMHTNIKLKDALSTSPHKMFNMM